MPAVDALKLTDLGLARHEGASSVYAVVSHVAFTPGLEAKARAELRDEVVPDAHAAAGFDSGLWLISTDGGTGVGLEIFATRDAALAHVEKRRALSETYHTVTGRFDLFEVAAYER